MFARARRRRGAPAWAGRASRSDFARTLGFEQRLDRGQPARRCRSTPSSTPPTPPDLPALALDLVEPAGRVVYIGLAGSPSLIDTRTLALKDVTAVGILSASPGLDDTIARTRPVRSTRDRWSPPPSASTRSARCSAVSGRRGRGRDRRSTSTHGSAEPNADGLTFAGTRFCRAEGEVRPKVISDDVADRGAHDVCDVGGRRVSPAEPPASRAMEPWPVDRPEPSSATTRPRVAAIDMLKVSLVSWVIGGHALLGYAAIGGWPYDEVSEATLPRHVELVLSVALGPTALFVIGTFFFLAGMFAPGERSRLGGGGFIRRRLVRLGLPWLSFLVLVWPLCMWLAYRAAGYDVRPWETFLHRQPFLDSGPLWFAQVLLYVSIAYGLWPRLDPRHHGADFANRPAVGPMTLALAILLIATASFLVRLQFPARSQQILDLHLWQWPQCMGMFALGVLVSSQGWISRVPDSVATWCRRAVLAALAAAPAMMVAFGVDDFARDGEPFLGGWHLEAAVLAVVEAVLVVAGSVALLHLAQTRLSSPGRLLTRCARGGYIAYMLQVPVLIGLSVALRPLEVPALAKGVTVGVLGVALCLGLGSILAPTRRHRR